MIRLSLVIPTYNRAAPLLAALESVVRQDLPPQEWECVVVNNNSPDDTEARFGAFAAAHPGVTLRMVREESPGVSYARNRGLAEARGGIVAFIDDDERVNEGFLRAYADFFDSHPEAVVAGGRIVAEYPGGRPAWMSKWVEMPIANPMDFGDAVRPFPAGRVPGGGNMAFRRFRSLARPGERRADRRRGERLLRTAAARRRDDLVRSRCGDVAYHPPVEAHGGVLPAAEPQRGREPAAPGADSRPHGEDLRARDREVGSDAAAGADHAAPQVPLALAPALGDRAGNLLRSRAVGGAPETVRTGMIVESAKKGRLLAEASFVFRSGVSCVRPVSESKRGISRA